MLRPARTRRFALPMRHSTSGLRSLQLEQLEPRLVLAAGFQASLSYTLTSNAKYHKYYETVDRDQNGEWIVERHYRTDEPEETESPPISGTLSIPRAPDPTSCNPNQPGSPFADCNRFAAKLPNSVPSGAARESAAEASAVVSASLSPTSPLFNRQVASVGFSAVVNPSVDNLGDKFDLVEIDGEEREVALNVLSAFAQATATGQITVWYPDVPPENMPPGWEPAEGLREGQWLGLRYSATGRGLGSTSAAALGLPELPEYVTSTYADLYGAPIRAGTEIGFQVGASGNAYKSNDFPPPPQETAVASAGAVVFALEQRIVSFDVRSDTASLALVFESEIHPEAFFNSLYWSYDPEFADWQDGYQVAGVAVPAWKIAELPITSVGENLYELLIPLSDVESPDDTIANPQAIPPYLIAHLDSGESPGYVDGDVFELPSKRADNFAILNDIWAESLDVSIDQESGDADLMLRYGATPSVFETVPEGFGIELFWSDFSIDQLNGDQLKARYGEFEVYQAARLERDIVKNYLSGSEGLINIPVNYECVVDACRLASDVVGKPLRTVSIAPPPPQFESPFLVMQVDYDHEFQEDRYGGIVGEVDERNNFVSLGSDFRITKTEWGDPNGVYFEYEYIGWNSIDQDPEVRFYWSVDEFLDSGDRSAAELGVRAISATGYDRQRFPGNNLEPPSAEERYLLVHLDAIGLIGEPRPGGSVDEQFELNNVGAVDIESVKLPTTDASWSVFPLFDTNYDKGQIVELSGSLRNYFPFPVNVAVTRRLVSDEDTLNEYGTKFFLPAEVPSRTSITEPGTFAWEDAWQFTWDWIPKENPLKATDPDLKDILIAGLLDATNLVFPPWGRIVSYILSTAQFVIQLNWVQELKDARTEDLNVELQVTLEPQVHNAPALSTWRKAIRGEVDEEHKAAFETYIQKLKEFEQLLYLYSTLTPQAGSLVATLSRMQRIGDGYLDAEWNRAVDPPDPEFAVLLLAELMTDPNIALLPSELLQRQFWFRNVRDELHRYVYPTIDKKDGALLERNPEWEAEQYMLASTLEHRSVFAGAQSAAAEAILVPYFDQQLGPVDQQVARMRESGLLPEARDLLVDSGWSEEVIEQIDSLFRNMTVERAAAYNGENSTSFSYLQQMADMKDAFIFYTKALEIRTTQLSLPVRELLPDEIHILEQFASQADASVNELHPTPGTFEMLEEYASAARMIGLRSNNLSAVAPHLEAAYLASINGPTRFANFEKLRQFIEVGHDDGHIDQDLSASFTVDVQAIEQRIQTGEFSIAVDRLNQFIERVGAVPDGTLDVVFRNNLGDYLVWLMDNLTMPAEMDSPEVNGLGSDAELVRGDTVQPYSQANVNDPRLGTYSGGQLVVRWHGQSLTQAIVVVANEIVEPTADGEIFVHGELIASYTGGVENEPLTIRFRSAATPERVTQVVRSIALTSNESEGESEVQLTLHDGVGGISDTHVLRIVHVDAATDVGDFNSDGAINDMDVELLCAAVFNASGDNLYDLNLDGLVNDLDVSVLINSILGTVRGDANLDGVFDSADLVKVFQSGEYEDGVPRNSTWGDGDWNCDGEFTTSDLVVAFQAGGYVRNAHIAAHTTQISLANVLFELDSRSPSNDHRAARQECLDRAIHLGAGEPTNRLSDLTLRDRWFTGPWTFSDNSLFKSSRNFLTPAEPSCDELHVDQVFADGRLDVD